MISKNKKRITVSLLNENVKYLESNINGDETKSDILNDIIEKYLYDKLYKNWLSAFIATSIIPNEFPYYKIRQVEIELFENYISVFADCGVTYSSEYILLYFNLYIDGKIEITKEVHK